MLRKLGFYLIAAWVALTINFLLPQLIPGNPVEILISRMSQSGTVPADEDQVLTRLLGLGTGNIFEKYWQYLDGLAHLQLGLSVTDFPTPVSTEISLIHLLDADPGRHRDRDQLGTRHRARDAGGLEARLEAGCDHPVHHPADRDAVLLARADPDLRVRDQCLARPPGRAGLQHGLRHRSRLEPGRSSPRPCSTRCCPRSPS